MLESDAALSGFSRGKDERAAEGKPPRCADSRPGHTFATRLRAASVKEEDRAALLGHARRTTPGIYASASWDV